MKFKMINALRKQPWYLLLLPLFFVMHGFTENFGFINFWDTLILAITAALFAHHNNSVIVFLILLFFVSCVPALFFLKNINNIKAAKWIEYMSVLWTFGMYLSLGGVPMFMNLINK